MGDVARRCETLDGLKPLIFSSAQQTAVEISELIVGTFKSAIRLGSIASKTNQTVHMQKEFIICNAF